MRLQNKVRIASQLTQLLDKCVLGI